jgi:mono/diheme cytochrome c family protein
LGFNTAQLNRDFDYGGGPENQIAALSRAGYFSSPVSGVHTLPVLADSTNAAHSVEHRVRSYLAGNCVQCHQPGGPSQGLWDARLTTATSQAGLIDGDLISDGGDASNRVVVPGSLAKSMLLARVATRGSGQMPPIATRELDGAGIDLLSTWITNSLSSYQSFADWQVEYFGSSTETNAAPDADFDNDGAVNSLEYLTDTDPTRDSDHWRIEVQQIADKVQITFAQIANRGFELQWASDLSAPASWQPLDTPANRPFFSATNFSAVIEDVLTNAATRFYRVRVFER